MFLRYIDCIGSVKQQATHSTAESYSFVSQANDLVSAVCKVVSGWLVPSATPPSANSLDTQRVHPTKRRSMRAVCSLFSELHIMGLLLLRAHGAQPEVPSTSVLSACLIELASNPRLKALYEKTPREVAIMDLIHRLGQPNRGRIPEHGPGSLGGDRCYATLMREGFHLPAAQYAQLRGCIEDALASYLAMGADAKCVFDFLLGQVRGREGCDWLNDSLRCVIEEIFSESCVHSEHDLFLSL